MNTKKITMKRVAAYALTPLLSLSPATIGVGVIAGGALTVGVESAEAQVRGVRRTARRTGRRTARRVVRRTGRRLTVLPRGAAPVMIGGASYYYVNNAYWEPVHSGGNVTYVEVIVEG